MELTPTTKDGKLHITYDEDGLRAELEQLIVHIKDTGQPYDFCTFSGGYNIHDGHEALGGEECYLCGLPNHPYLDWKSRHDGNGEYEFNLEDLTDAVLPAIREFVDYIAEQIESSKTDYTDIFFASFRILAYARNYRYDFYESDVIWEKTNIPFKCSWRTD